MKKHPGRKYAVLKNAWQNNTPTYGLGESVIVDYGDLPLPGSEPSVSEEWAAFHAQRIALWNRLGAMVVGDPRWDVDLAPRDFVAEQRVGPVDATGGIRGWHSGTTCTRGHKVSGRTYDGLLQNYYYTDSPNSWRGELSDCGRIVADRALGRLEFMQVNGVCVAGELSSSRNALIAAVRGFEKAAVRGKRRPWLDTEAALIEECFYAVDLFDGHCGVPFVVWLGQRWQGVETLAWRAYKRAVQAQQGRQSQACAKASNPDSPGSLASQFLAEDPWLALERADEFCEARKAMRPRVRRATETKLQELANTSPERFVARLNTADSQW